MNEIKQNGREWSLNKPYYDEFLVELPKLVQKFDLSEDDSTISPEMSKEQNNLNDQQLAALIHQATAHANREEIPQSSNSSNRGESGTEDTILGMQAKDLVTLINAGVQALDGTTNPQGSTAEDFVTQISNLVRATGGDINNLLDMVSDILGNPQNTNDAAWDLD
ncbi:hypothetical protein ACE5D9_02045 [Rickettsia sp. 2024-CO-Wats]|uniref:hypothetical protein n=1 Tax=unclassified Rickettsia TaxID=114295 RepID=UPI00370D3EF3